MCEHASENSTTHMKSFASCSLVEYAYHMFSKACATPNTQIDVSWDRVVVIGPIEKCNFWANTLFLASSTFSIRVSTT